MIARRAVVTTALALAVLGCAASTRSDPGGPRVQVGIASYYGKEFHGKKTASGERFDMHAMTAAHRTLAFGTKVRVTNLENGKKVVVRINDRGPAKQDRIIDLSRDAARKIGMTSAGLAKVRVEVLG